MFSSPRTYSCRADSAKPSVPPRVVTLLPKNLVGFRVTLPPSWRSEQALGEVGPLEASAVNVYFYLRAKESPVLVTPFNRSCVPRSISSLETLPMEAWQFLPTTFSECADQTLGGFDAVTSSTIDEVHVSPGWPGEISGQACAAVMRSTAQLGRGLIKGVCRRYGLIIEAPCACEVPWVRQDVHPKRAPAPQQVLSHCKPVITMAYIVRKVSFIYKTVLVVFLILIIITRLSCQEARCVGNKLYALLPPLR
ncbi:hypothetical protein COCSUDRAFT_45660 [Coccomyxa subellipsoidea C-169]|uniref:Uncharacterized protein n=1 Tax=Coccomyxa subellipsoidea (strain C-169) TaxID=574566 RepID=I0YI13_COCSC|nr:hypothetical protein COCSUDRAFT_45660 [Coccomyxa subellipsoidea C-169]EIE18032.1 hypothetical protein COCSUDRAFT_45660 [Coccomyxa subellipsoidea C-169]|eukprot:XP_005642576.1 hypothetical protein COCSUDRAFT_45660 [Coccomyxa subellipsoidea C-169]